MRLEFIARVCLYPFSSPLPACNATGGTGGPDCVCRPGFDGAVLFAFDFENCSGETHEMLDDVSYIVVCVCVCLPNSHNSCCMPR